MADAWFVLLTRARAQLDVSQAELAARSHVSLASIKSYETGKRHPSRPYLTAILDALKVGREERNAIMHAAGFAIDGSGLGPEHDGFMFTPAEAEAEIASVQWPAFVLNEMMQVVAANDICQRLWGVDLKTDYLEPAERNFLTVASDPKFADRVANWDECVGVICSIWRGHFRGGEDLESPSPYFNALLERFLQGDPKYVARFLTIWQKAAPAIAKVRWSYPVVWDEPGIGVMRFRSSVSAAHEPDGTSFNDWVPVGAESWVALERLRGR